MHTFGDTNTHKSNIQAGTRLARLEDIAQEVYNIAYTKITENHDNTEDSVVDYVRALMVEQESNHIQKNLTYHMINTNPRGGHPGERTYDTYM